MSSAWQNFLTMVPSVYYRKNVVIENHRLWVLQMTSICLVIFIICMSPLFVRVVRSVKGQTRMTVWPDPSLSMFDFPLTGLFADIADWSSYAYQPGAPDVTSWMFGVPALATYCKHGVPAPGVGACVSDGDLKHLAAEQGNTQIFVPTAFTEELHLYSGNCPWNLDADGQCRHGQSYILPHPGNFSCHFTLDFQVQLPNSIFHSMSGLKHLPTQEMLMIMMNSNRDEVSRYGDKAVISLTVADALNLAMVKSLDDDLLAPDDVPIAEFPNDHVTGGRPKGRVTGLDIIVWAEVHNNGVHTYDHDGPVAEVDVHGRYTWNTKRVVEDYQTPSGAWGIRTRTYSGIRFFFHKSPTALFAWFQLHEIAYAFTLWTFWLQFPLWLVFYFAIYMLGNLSEVYTGFLYEDVNLHNEFNGVSTRMLEASYAFNDLHDIQEDDNPGKYGISLMQAKARMDEILKSSKELDKKERDQFSEFFFTHACTRMDSGLEAIQLDEFLRTVATNEQLFFDDIVGIVDTDATHNTLEKMFMDTSLRAFGTDDQRIGHQRQAFGVDRAQIEEDKHNNRHDTMITNLMAKRDLNMLGRHSNLMRTRYGQGYSYEALEKLEDALDCLSEAMEDRRRQKEDAERDA